MTVQMQVRQEAVSQELSRCTISYVVVTWARGRSALAPGDEDAAFYTREQERVAAQLRELTPPFEVVLDEIEIRGVPLQREPIPGVAEIIIGSPTLGFAKGQSAFSVRASCLDRPRGLAVMRELAERFGALLTPAPRFSRATDEDFLITLARFTEQQRTEPRYLQLARWLELAALVPSEAPRRPCAVCGATAIEVEEKWVDSDWHASYRDSLNAICLEAPHVVTLSES